MQKPYSRAYRLNDLFYFIIALLLLVFIILTIFSKKNDYTLLCILLYLPFELFFHPKRLIIDESKVIVLNIFAAGLLKSKLEINLSNIKAVIDISIPDETADPNSNGNLFFFQGNGKIRFGLYQITYYDSNKMLRKLKIHLNQTEIKFLKNFI
ncbi:MAG: hypothetical protein K2X37_12455 [Chitinophagaceae bacterium]|nr:hypothetical protein [Chitinophagaceae bacterium]